MSPPNESTKGSAEVVRSRVSPDSGRSSANQGLNSEPSGTRLYDKGEGRCKLTGNEANSRLAGPSCRGSDDAHMRPAPFLRRPLYRSRTRAVVRVYPDYVLAKPVLDLVDTPPIPMDQMKVYDPR